MNDNDNLASSAPATASEGATEAQCTNGTACLGGWGPGCCNWPATGVTSSDGDRGLSEGSLAQKWTSASIAARKAEHHFPADCLAEAVQVVRHLTEQLDVLAARTAQSEGVERDG